jgi:sucrose phosphorylase
MKNQVQLITYVDRLGGGGIAALSELLQGPLNNLFGGVHLLPFYYPIDGVDAGFDPIDHTQVDPRLGHWRDVQQLSTTVDVMADVIVNHMSSESPQFLDYSTNGDQSKYAQLFLSMDSVFPVGATESDLSAVYRPRPGLPFTSVQLKSGQKKLLWTTFTPKQIDIAVELEAGQNYLHGILDKLQASGIKMIRLDACGYAIKRAGTNCFMLPETFEFVEKLSEQARSRGIEVLVEIHSYFRKQIAIAAKVDRVYDFALPPLVLHSFLARDASALTHWLKIRPNNAITVLDTHDGIGIIDIGSDAEDRAGSPGLVTDSQLADLVESIHFNSNHQSRQATGEAASNLDLYQVNCTYFDALARNETNYLIARAIQFFMPGIPQVYYVGLLAGLNDMALLDRSGVGRDINRQYYSKDDISNTIRRPVVARLFALIQLRNLHLAFNGDFSFQQTSVSSLTMRWSESHAAAEKPTLGKPTGSRLSPDHDGLNEAQWVQLDVDFANTNQSTLSYTEDGTVKTFVWSL